MISTSCFPLDIETGRLNMQKVELESLVPWSLEALREDEAAQALMSDLAERGQAELTREERKARQRSLDSLNVPPFQKLLADAGVTPLRRGPTEIMQLNIGLYCNQVAGQRIHDGCPSFLALLY